MKKSYYTIGTKFRIFIDAKEMRCWIALLAAAALVEIWLARREKRWPGLILPGLAFLLGAVKIARFYMSSRPTSIALGVLLLEFALGNAATLVLLVIYAACRESRKRKRRRDREKMQIEDLNEL